MRLLLLVLLTSLPAFAVTIHSGLEQRRAATFSAIHDAQHIAEDLADEQERLLGTTRHVLAVLARLPEVRDLKGPACSALFSDLLARIEAGRMSLSPEPVSVGAVIQESMDLVSPLASKRHVHLLRAGTDDASDLFVLADRQRLKQVLLNLLSNAVKFNRQEGTISLSCQEAPGARVRIGVRDTGPGIPPERMERLFVPFERLGAEQAGVEGTGLGLVLSRRLAEAMGGALGVESEAGVGSTFWVDLPSAESPRQRLERAGVALPAPADLDDSTRVRIVLYIEDNLSNVKLIQHLLAHRPEVRLIPAMQGRLGLELAREHRPHLVLLDLHLPDIPGEEVLRLLQESPKTQGIPVVVISADATPGQVGRLIEAGARDYLTKPLDVRRLMGVLDSILGQA
ncbi:MAG: ATP-binding protein [bacterium]|nr:ATP-binding protein [bacterium]